MKKTNLAQFADTAVSSTPAFDIQMDDYLKGFYINKVLIRPLQKLEGNVESKTGRDCYMQILDGSGSMEVNGSVVSVQAGEIVFIHGSEKFTIINDSLNSVLQFVSIVSRK